MCIYIALNFNSFLLEKGLTPKIRKINFSFLLLCFIQFIFIYTFTKLAVKLQTVIYIFTLHKPVFILDPWTNNFIVFLFRGLYALAIKL